MSCVADFRFKESKEYPKTRGVFLKKKVIQTLEWERQEMTITKVLTTWIVRSFDCTFFMVVEQKKKWIKNNKNKYVEHNFSNIFMSIHACVTGEKVRIQILELVKTGGKQR